MQVRNPLHSENSFALVSCLSSSYKRQFNSGPLSEMEVGVFKARINQNLLPRGGDPFRDFVCPESMSCMTVTNINLSMRSIL